jgi:hypothetical protein
MAGAVDFDAHYTLPPDLRIVQRDATTIQIGTEQPRRTLLVDAPTGATAVLGRLTGAVSAGEAITTSEGDPLIWRSVLEALLGAGLLVPALRQRPRPPHLSGERLSLIHRHGAAAADRLLDARSDALVVVDGSGPVADAVTALLAASGIGHVHHRAGAAAARAGRRGRSTLAAPDSSGSGPLPVQQDPAWRAAPDVRVHRPAPQMPPSVVVLASDTPPDPSRAAELVTSLIPHLAVQVSQARVIVGPLVLPGRSACLNCVDRHRTDADAGWPAVARALREDPVPVAALAVQAAGELATGQVLDLVDGLRCPATVGASIERPAGTFDVYRRGWSPHPDCGCRLLSGHL